MEISPETLKLDQWRLHDIITGDEIWVYRGAIDSKQSNMTWCGEGVSSTTVIRRGHYHRKNIFVIFFRTTGLEFIHLIESSNSITGDYYKNNCCKSFLKSITRKRSNADLCSVKLHDDNARPHQTNDIKTFLQEERIMIIRHSPYSPDLLHPTFGFSAI